LRLQKYRHGSGTGSLPVVLGFVFKKLDRLEACPTTLAEVSIYQGVKRSPGSWGMSAGSMPCGS
jgi:hypothetical protein